MKSPSEITAYQILESLQLKYLALKGKDHVDPLNEGLLENILKQFLQTDDVSHVLPKIEEELSGIVLNTKYQDPYSYSILYHIVQDIEAIKGEVFEGMDLNIKMPCFGTVDFNMFSAEICSPACDDKLIIISDGLLAFANLISKVVVQMLPIKAADKAQHFSTRKEDILAHIESTPEVKLRFFDLMLACLVTGEPPQARQYFPPLHLGAFLHMVRTSFETFVVAHEYSHSVLGHLDDKNIHLSANLESIDEAELKQIFHHWNDEIHADLYGAGLTLAIMRKKGFDLYTSMLGVIVCTSSFDLFDQIESLRSGNTDEIHVSKTHPPGFLRKKMLLQQYFDGSNVELFETIDQVLEHLWKDFLPFFQKLKDLIEGHFKRSVYDVPFRITQNVMYRLFEEAGKE